MRARGGGAQPKHPGTTPQHPSIRESRLNTLHARRACTSADDCFLSFCCLPPLRPVCLPCRRTPSRRSNIQPQPAHTAPQPPPYPLPPTTFSSWLPSRRRCFPATSVTCTCRDCAFSSVPVIHLCQKGPTPPELDPSLRGRRACWRLAKYLPGYHSAGSEGLIH